MHKKELFQDYDKFKKQQCYEKYMEYICVKIQEH